MADSIFPPTTTVSVAAAGAVSGDGSSGDPLTVVVDGATIDINGSNELETIGDSAGPFTTITSITVANGLVTDLQGS